VKNIRVKQAAEYLGVSKSLLDKLRMGSDGPRFFRLGRAVIYNTADLDSWLAERRVPANDNVRAAS
jgi:predicted DNA-binding transcriptional regulator AlpA